MLDKTMTTDPNVGWKTGATDGAAQFGNVAAFESNPERQVSNGKWWVRGGMNATAPNDKIYFRIGLKSTIAAGAAPRYDVVLLTYCNGKYKHRIFIRQGESDDYLMRPGDPVNTGGITSRDHAVKFSPYNLTAPAGKMNTALGFEGGIFTNYPSQAGALFIWNTTTAWAPVGTASGFVYPSSFKDIWDDIRATTETCPDGYRRPTDGPTDVITDGTDISTSEVRQSLWLKPQANVDADHDAPVDLSNVIVGCYADGWFDRRNIAVSQYASGNYQPISTVADSDPYNVAYRGMLFYNPYNNASLFMPYTGYRSSNTEITGAGVKTMPWTSSRQATDVATSWFISLGSNSATSHYAYMNYKNFACNAIRCVKDEFVSGSGINLDDGAWNGIE